MRVDVAGERVELLGGSIPRHVMAGDTRAEPESDTLDEGNARGDLLGTLAAVAVEQQMHFDTLGISQPWRVRPSVAGQGFDMA